MEIAGVDAVGLGSDFDGIGCAPEGLDSVEKWPNLTRALLEEGYTPIEIRKIYGENTLRPTPMTTAMLAPNFWRLVQRTTTG